MGNNLQDIRPRLKALGLYQIAGGIIGIGLTIYFVSNSVALTGILMLIILFAIALNCYSIYSGWILLRSPLKGLRLSKISQILQVVHFAFYGYAFKYVAGVYLSIGLDLTESFYFTFNFGLSTWQFSFNTGEVGTIISLNIVALFLIIFIDGAIKKLKTIELEERVLEIGL